MERESHHTECVSGAMEENAPHPVFLVSIPKAGTYLLASILERLGLVPTWWHVHGDFFKNYALARTWDEVRRHDGRFRVARPVEETIPAIPPGRFAVGHLPCDERCRKTLARCRVVFLKRELRQCLVSNMRWCLRAGPRGAWKRGNDSRTVMLRFLRAHGDRLMDRYGMVARWNERAAAVLRHEEIAQTDERAAAAVNRVAKSLDLERSATPELLKAARSRPTLTRSARPTEVTPCWSAKAERWFRRRGGTELNAMLGYAEGNG